MIDRLVSSLSRILDLGGPVVLLLGALSVLALSVVLFKLWQFRQAGVGRHGALEHAISCLDAGDRAGALAALAGAKSYLAPVLVLGVREGVAPARLEAEAEARFARLESGFRVLDGVAQIAPLLGLFGTVLGMISAFQALQAAGATVDPSILAGGIWVALLTTAVGLAVAMPTSVALSWLEARMDADRVLAGRCIRTVHAPVTPSAPDAGVTDTGATYA